MIQNVETFKKNFRRLKYKTKLSMIHKSLSKKKNHLLAYFSGRPQITLRIEQLLDTRSSGGKVRFIHS